MREKQKAILLNLTPDMFYQLEEVAIALGKTKTAILRQCIERNLTFARKHEVPLVQEQNIAFGLEAWMEPY